MIDNKLYTLLKVYECRNYTRAAQQQTHILSEWVCIRLVYIGYFQARRVCLSRASHGGDNGSSRLLCKLNQSDLCRYSVDAVGDVIIVREVKLPFLSEKKAVMRDDLRRGVYIENSFPHDFRFFSADI